MAVDVGAVKFSRSILERLRYLPLGNGCALHPAQDVGDITPSVWSGTPNVPLNYVEYARLLAAQQADFAKSGLTRASCQTHDCPSLLSFTSPSITGVVQDRASVYEVEGHVPVVITDGWLCCDFMAAWAASMPVSMVPVKPPVPP